MCPTCETEEDVPVGHLGPEDGEESITHTLSHRCSEDGSFGSGED